MPAIAELECTLTQKARREKFPLEKGPYLIGRSSKEEIRRHPAYYDRLPDWAKALIDGATHSIPIRGLGVGREACYISRAQIWLEPREAYAKIVDLKSMNRTYVNGTRVQSDDDSYEMRYVYPEDTISIGAGVANLKYKLLHRTHYPHHALFVGCGEDVGDLESIRNSVYALKKEIVGRGFAGNTLEYIGSEARKKEILLELEKMGDELGEDSVLLFYFAGNTQRGRSRKLRVHDGSISPKELFGVLSDSRCQKLFIMDGPHTSAWAGHEMPPRSALIGNTEEAWEAEVKSRSGDIMRYLSLTVCKAFQTHDSIDIKRLVEDIRRNPLIHSVRQEVACVRKTWIVLPRQSPRLSPA